MRKFVTQAAVATLIVACSLCLQVAAQSGSSANHSQKNTDSTNSQAQARMQASRMAVHAASTAPIVPDEPLSARTRAGPLQTSTRLWT